VDGAVNVEFDGIIDLALCGLSEVADRTQLEGTANGSAWNGIVVSSQLNTLENGIHDPVHSIDNALLLRHLRFAERTQRDEQQQERETSEPAKRSAGRHDDG